MADTIKHRHQTAITSLGADVDKNEWNDSHVFTGGIDGQVVTRNSGAADGWGWTTPAVASGLTLLETHAASASASLVFTTISSTYNDYLLKLDQILPATNAVDLQMQLSSDGGSTWLTTYQYSIMFHGVTDPSVGLISSAAATSIPMSTGVTNTAVGTCGDVSLFDLNGATNKAARYVTTLKQPAPKFYQFTGAAWYTGNNVINAVRFLFSSGNIASGSIKLYGFQ